MSASGPSTARRSIWTQIRLDIALAMMPVGMCAGTDAPISSQPQPTHQLRQFAVHARARRNVYASEEVTVAGNGACLSPSLSSRAASPNSRALTRARSPLPEFLSSFPLFLHYGATKAIGSSSGSGVSPSTMGQSGTVAISVSTGAVAAASFVFLGM
ncbi:hypothetical protein MSAN_00124400 [Mycena sanguinolenta]|uniref:Uncharacterized protein n=1 Tax=Mycena sanguinolenta TaxID=230812 RepID=A0A8H6ZGN5_9AGAR|nr:hypothetical protein MSAN_00124400 [Mycena sanguinolenta]